MILLNRTFDTFNTFLLIYIIYFRLKYFKKEFTISTHKSSNESIVPAGWGKHNDADGHTFYTNPDGEAQWERPPAAV